MFGFGGRQQELKAAADKVTGNLLEDAIREDRHRQGRSSNSEMLTPDDYARAVAAWCAMAGSTWQSAKRGIPDALRQTARNYLFGTGMPVKPLKARLWLEVAKIIEEADFLTEQPTVHPFWSSMETELDGILTSRERIKARKDAMDWARTHWQLQRMRSS